MKPDMEVAVTRLERLRERRDSMAAEYGAAIRHFSDSEWVRGVLDTVRNDLMAVRQYKPGEEAVKAVYLLAQLEMSLSSIVNQVDAVWTFEALKEEINKARMIVGLTGPEPQASGDLSP